MNTGGNQAAPQLSHPSGRDPSNLNSRHARIKQRMVQKYQDDFEKLKDIFADAIIAQEFCPDEAVILAIFEGLKTFLHRQGFWDEAQESAQRALDVARRVGNTKQEAEATLQCGLIADETAEFKKATSYYQTAITLAQSIGDLGVQAEATRRLGWIVQVAGKLDTAVAYYEDALALHVQDDNALGQVRAYRDIAMLELERSQIEQVYAALTQAKAVNLADEDFRESNRLFAGIEIEMGRVSGRKGEIEKALAHYETALDLAKQAGDKSMHQHILFLGTQLQENKLSFAEAESVYQAYRDYAADVRDKRAQTAAYLAWGNLYFKQDDFDSAQDFYDLAGMYAGLNQRAIIAARKGNIALHQKDYAAAKRFYENALMLFQKIDAWKEMAGCYQQLGIVAQCDKLFQESVDYYLESYRIRCAKGLDYDAIQSLYQLGELYRLLRQFTVACHYYLEANKLAKRFNFAQSSMIQARIDELGCVS